MFMEFYCSIVVFFFFLFFLRQKANRANAKMDTTKKIHTLKEPKSQLLIL